MQAHSQLLAASVNYVQTTPSQQSMDHADVFHVDQELKYLSDHQTPNADSAHQEPIHRRRNHVNHVQLVHSHKVLAQLNVVYADVVQKHHQLKTLV
jgi:hypothetical protein